MSIISWIIVNKVALFEGYLAFIGFASVVIRITPTVKDDHFLKRYLKFTGKFLAWNRK